VPETLPGLDIVRMEIAAGGSMQGTPHTPGTREYLTCESGVVELAAAGEVHRLEAGDALVFRGDQRHTYRNPGRSPSVAVSVVAFAPVKR
jgi:quercetin dioxygenase-like cupin family protein